MLCSVRVIAALAAALVISAASARVHAQTRDPRQVWSTFETAHFRVHYYQGLRPLAERVGAIGEGIYSAVGGLMGWRVRQTVEVVLTDNTDDSNGSAITVPFNAIRLYATAPDDQSELSDYDDWLQALMLHEFTHIAHMENVSGIPAVINAILGRVYPPNNVQPRWILEGIAVYSESRNTTGGRMRSSIWDMYLRADALEDHLVRLDQISTGPNRWPHGAIYYLYGSYFITYIAQRFGEHAIRDISSYYGGQLVPFGINRAIQRATGYTYEELWEPFMQSLRERYGRQRDAIEARGLRVGERITAQGELAWYPRFLHDGHTVAFESGNGRSNGQIRTLDVGHVGGPVEPVHDGDWVANFSGFALDPTGTRMILSDTGFHRGIYFYRDLYERTATLRADGVLRTSENHNITDGARTLYPDISPDGEHVAFTVNHRGTSSLFEMTLSDHHMVSLVRPHRYDQAFTPRYSPDGRSIVYSSWSRGGYRDIRLLDRETGQLRDLTHDRAADTQPVFSPDGRYVVFSSDRTGVANLYALELETGVLRQITNVLGGAFMPAISPDGQTIVYSGYHSRGYDLYRIPFDPASWLDATEAAPRQGVTIPTPAVAGTTHRYTPIRTLVPRTWSAELTDDGFGPQVWTVTGATDVVGNHAYGLRTGIGLTRGDPSFDLAYTYRGMRPDMHLHAYRAVNASNWNVGGRDVRYPLERSGGDASLSVSFPGLFVRNSLSISYEAQYQGPVGGLPFGDYIDPNEPAPLQPFRGFTSALRAGWRFSRVLRYTYDISAHEGYEGSLGLHAADRVLGSNVGVFDISAAAAAYVPMPWASYRRHHVLALRASGGAGVTDTGGYRIFFLGGFPTFSVNDFVNTVVSLNNVSGVALRGYAPFSRGGSMYYLANIEYRFPIVQLDRGPSTLPVYVSRLYGSVFMDMGNAFSGRFRLEDIAIGVGAELLADLVFGYYLGYTLRIGVAQGLNGADALTQFYALFSAPF